METEHSYCTNCGEAMDVNAAYCVKCGVAKGKIKHYCDQCGAAVTPEQDFCTTCGNKLTGDSSLEKGKQAVQKFASVAKESSSSFANKARSGQGQKVKPAWLAGGIGALVVIAIIIYLLIPKGLSGSYEHKTTLFGTTSTDTLTFKGKQVTEVQNGNTGTYKISGDTLEMELGGSKMTAKLSSDKKSFTIQSASGLAGLAAGIKYTKVK